MWAWREAEASSLTSFLKVTDLAICFHKYQILCKLENECYSWLVLCIDYWTLGHLSPRWSAKSLLGCCGIGFQGQKKKKNLTIALAMAIDRKGLHFTTRPWSFLAVSPRTHHLALWASVFSTLNWHVSLIKWNSYNGVLGTLPDRWQEPNKPQFNYPSTTT